MVAPRVIPHSDGAGVIERVGPGADPSRVGAEAHELLEQNKVIGNVVLEA